MKPARRMNPSDFGEASPGRVVRIGPGWGFVPSPLPPRGWAMDDELWRALLEARSALMLVEGGGQRLLDPASLLRPLQRREAIQSSTIEHIDASAEQLLLFEIEQDPGAAEAVREVANYERAVRRGLELMNDMPLSLRLFRELHRALLVGVRGEEKTPGEFRRVQVSIGDRFFPPPPDELAPCLDAFERFIHAPSDTDALIRVFWMHYQFEAIHPFRDGNGRVGRLLLTLMTQSLCGLSQPWLYMSAYFERHRPQYMDLLWRVSTEGAWRDWTLFCLRGVAEQAADTSRRITRLLELRSRCLRDLAAAGAKARLTQTLDELLASPVLTIPVLQARRRVDYKTARSDIERLCEIGILSELPGRYPKTYIAQEIVRAGHDDLI